MCVRRGAYPTRQCVPGGDCSPPHIYYLRQSQVQMQPLVSQEQEQFPLLLPLLLPPQPQPQLQPQLQELQELQELQPQELLQLLQDVAQQGLQQELATKSGKMMLARPEPQEEQELQAIRNPPFWNVAEASASTTSYAPGSIPVTSSRRK